MLALDPARYLEHSDSEGHPVGRDPSKLSQDDLLALNGPRIRSKAIRAKCLDCCAGSQSEVRKCVSYKCALWPFRLTRSPFRNGADAEETDDLDAAFT